MLCDIGPQNQSFFYEWFLRIGQYLAEIQLIYNLKVVQMKLLAMDIINQKFSFDIFMIANLQNIYKTFIFINLY